MKEPNTFFQDISVHRRVVITVGIFAVLIIVTGLYGLIAIVEMNKRLHETVLEGQKMVKAIDAARSAEVHFKKQVQEWKNILLRGNSEEKTSLRCYQIDPNLSRSWKASCIV